MNKNINLLPLELRHNSGQKQDNYIKGLSVLIIIVVLLGGFVFFTLIRFIEYRLDGIEKELNVLKPKIEQAKFYHNENEEMQVEIRDMESIEEAKVHWSMVLGTINEHLPQDLWVTHFSFNQDRTIKIMGIAENLSPIGVLLYELNGLTCFESFSLEKAEEIKQGSLSLTEFSLKGMMAKGSV